MVCIFATPKKIYLQRILFSVFSQANDSKKNLVGMQKLQFYSEIPINLQRTAGCSLEIWNVSQIK